MKFVDVKNDVAFRKIFGNENRKEVLISFLNAVLLFEEGNKITDVEILTPYQLPELRGGKVTIVDVKARDQNGKNYIVEMQVAELEGFNDRVLYYAAKSYSSQIERGELYKNLNPTFFIGILDFTISQSPDYLSHHKMVDIKTGENVISGIEFNFIELPKFKKDETALTTIIDQWVYFIKNAENLQVIPKVVNDEGLLNAYEDADKHNWTQAELDAYDYVLMREEDDRNRWALATKKAVEAAVETAVEKTKTEERKKEKEHIAMNLLEAGILAETVAQTTGLTITEIQQIIDGFSSKRAVNK